MHGFEHLFHRRRYIGGLRALEYNYFLSQFAYGMIGLFGVVYIYQLGVQWWEGLWLMLVFYGLQRVVTIIVAPMSGRLLSRIGFRRVMAGSLVCLAGKLLLLSMSEGRGMGVLYAASILGGIYLAAYHVGFQALFLNDNDDQRVGEQLGLLTMIQRIALVVSPFVAGVLIQRFGFSVMFWVATGILLLSIVPLTLMTHHKHRVKAYDLKKVVKFMETQPRLGGAVYWMSLALAVSDFFWPLFLLTLVGGYALLGAVTSVVMLLSSVMVLMVGKTYDHRTLKRSYPIITGLTALFWVVRFLSSTLVIAATADLFGRFFSPLWWMKVRRYELRLGETVDGVVFGVAHTILESMGVLTTLLFGVWLLVMTHESWMTLAVLTTAGILISGYLVRKE